MPKTAVDEHGDALFREHKVRTHLPPEGRAVCGNGFSGTRHRQLDDHMPSPSCYPRPTERRRDLLLGASVPGPADAGHDLRSDLSGDRVRHHVTWAISAVSQAHDRFV
jgi:hypothetical protein